MQPKLSFPRQAAMMALACHLSHHWHVTTPPRAGQSHAQPSASSGSTGQPGKWAGSRAWWAQAQPGTKPAWKALWVRIQQKKGGRGPHSLSESPPACAGWSQGTVPRAGSPRQEHREGLGSEHHSQPSAPTHLPALPSPGACLLPSTSCLILSLETFRYLSQLHTWKKREGEGGEMLAVLPGHLLPAWSTQPRTVHPQQRLGSPQVACVTAGDNWDQASPTKGWWQNSTRHKFWGSQATRTSSPEALHLYGV